MTLVVNDTISPEMKNIKAVQLSIIWLGGRYLISAMCSDGHWFQNVQMRENITLLPEIIFGNLKFNTLKKSPSISLHIDKNDMSLL